MISRLHSSAGKVGARKSNLSSWSSLGAAGIFEMRPSEDQGDSGGGSVATSSVTRMQAGAMGAEENGDGEKNSSQTSEGQTAEMTSSPSETTGNVIARKLVTSQSLEEAMKGLIISQIRGPFVKVEEGLLNLLKQCLISENPFFSSAALSGHVDHFESVNDEDLGWGCGWRNIQILCSFLLAEDVEAREALFNGAGFVPDIPALQRWLEIAWNRGFDALGAEYFDWSIVGTRKWIGTTECAALLRSFGVRAKIVSFSALGGKRTRTANGEERGSAIDLTNDEETERPGIQNDGMKKCHTDSDTRGGSLNCASCGNTSRFGMQCRGIVHSDNDLCEGCLQAASQEGDNDGFKGSCGKVEKANHDTESGLDTALTETHQSRRHTLCSRFDGRCDGCGEPHRGRIYKCRTKTNLNLCSKCVEDVRLHPNGDRGSVEDYVIIEEHPASRNTGPPGPRGGKSGNDGESIVNEHGIMDQGRKSVEGKGKALQKELINFEADLRKTENSDYKETRWERGGMNMQEDKDIGTSLQDPVSKEEVGGIFGGDPLRAQPLESKEREKAGMDYSSSGAGEDHIDHHHLIEWVWSYFTESSTQRFASPSHHSRDPVIQSKRSPLYFQHQGHSRTIVGIERQRKPTGISEDVFLLVLDPSQSTEGLVKALKEKKGWQKLIKHDVHTLKETEYQVCYADPGIAGEEELAQLKVLSSLRYSYYAR